MSLIPSIHPLAIQHIRELRERWGVETTLEESLWIVRLCDQVMNPCEGERADLCGFPVRAGISDVYLWPFTVGASVWWQDKACVWWSGDIEFRYLALCFALANGRDGQTIRRVGCSKESARAIIRDWEAGLDCTRAELDVAVDSVLPPQELRQQPAPCHGSPHKTDFDQIIGEIEASTGIKADHWIWDVSREYTIRAWSRSRAVMQARFGGLRGSPTAADEALERLAQAKAFIVESRSKLETPAP